MEPVLTREAEEREEGEEACPGGLVRERLGYLPRLRGCGMWEKGLGHTQLRRYLGPRLLGKLGPLGKMGEPTPPCPGGSVPQLYAQWAPSGRCSTRGATLGSPRNGTSARVLLPCAPQGLSLSSPPHPHPLPLPPSSPTHRGPGVCANATSSFSCYLGKPLGCPEAQCFICTMGYRPADTAVLGSDGAGPLHPSTVP